MNCIFCKIAKGEQDAHIVYEDNDYLAFLDINPHSKGHTLVIPKEHHKWVYDLPTGTQASPNFEEMWSVVKQVTEMIQSALDPQFISYFTYGLEVPHAHVHIIPRESAAGGLLPPKIHVSGEELQKLAGKIRSAS